MAPIAGGHPSAIVPTVRAAGSWPAHPERQE